jgi:hypothetical protein
MALSTSRGIVGYDTSLTFSHTVTGNDCYLVAVGGIPAAGDFVSGVTYNGVAMTRIRADGLGTSSLVNYVYGLKIPVADGLPHNIVWSFTATIGFDSVAISKDNVNQTTPLVSESFTTTAYQNSPASLSVTTPSGSAAFSYISMEGNTIAMVPGAGQTEIGTQNALGGMLYRATGSFKADATAMSYSWATTEKQVTHTAFAFNPIAVSDTTAPTMTGTVTSSGVTSSGFTIDWSGTTRSDNVAVTGYETSPDAGTTWIDRGNVTSVTFTGLAASTSYTRLVRAYDAAANKSTPALSIVVVTSAPAGDTTVPVLAGSITQSTITSTSSQITWPAGSDNVAVTAYEVSKDNGTTYVDVGNVLTYTFTGLTASTAYTQRVRAKDAVGNVSTPALSLAVTTSAVAVGSFTSRPLVNNTGTVLASQSGWTVRINNGTTGSLIATKTALTTSSLGVLAYSDAGCTVGTTYEHIYVSSNGDKGLQDLVAA